MRVALILTVLGAAGCAPRPITAQDFNFLNNGLKVTSLNGLWRFHPGDNAAWADPQFDDSQWRLLRSDMGWSDQGYKYMSGYGWYRLSVAVPSGEGDMYLTLPNIFTSYQVFANGRIVGSFGRMPPDFTTLRGGHGETFRVPRSVLVNDKLVIAIRVWQSIVYARGYSGGPASGRSLIGDKDTIERNNALFLSATLFQFTPAMLVALLEILAGIGAIVLYFLRRSDREYLWFCILMLCGAGYGSFVIIQEFVPIQMINSDPYRVALNFVGYPFAELYFYTWLLKAPRSPWFRFVRTCVLLNLACALAFCWQNGAEWSIPAIQSLVTLFSIPQYIWVLILLFSRARENFMDAKWLLLPAVFQKTALIWNRIGATTFNLGWQHKTGLLTQIITHPVRVDLMQLANLIFLLSVFAILAFRFSRTRSSEERFASEVEAARSVQQYLIPDHLPATPGLVINSVYRPSREVGGDFFQVLPNPDGSVLIAVGDVAGKGLQAGMLATLIVGAIRVAAQFTADPSRILALLNQRLQGRGLVTCLALRIEHDGTLKIANAGHLPPYLNASELPIEGALPLGAVPCIEYPVTHFLLREGDTLTLMSDGVAEAKNSAGQLFGFERVNALLIQGSTASDLAVAAQAFGQEDDITVLTLTRLAVGAKTRNELGAPALSQSPA
jgi:hypothetical protein